MARTLARATSVMPHTKVDPHADIPAWKPGEERAADMQREQTILHRTPKGKMMRISAGSFSLLHPLFLEDASSVEDEGSEKEAYGRLKYARAYMNSKLQTP